MADDLSFTISANDQASKAVETVQKKIQDFGKDIAKMALGVAGPMALLQAGIGLAIDKYKEYQQAKIDARKEKEAELDAIAKAEQDKDLERQKQSVEAYKKAEAEKTAFFKRQEEERKKKLSLQEEIKQLEEELQRNFEPLTGGDLLAKLSEDYKDARNKAHDIYQQRQAGRQGVTDSDVYESRKKELEALKKFKEEERKQNEQIAKDKKEGVVKPEETKAVKDTVKVTVSSLREIGGSFGGGDVTTGIERQVELAQKQIDVLTTIAQNTSPKSDVGEPVQLGDTKFTEFGGYEGFLEAITAYQKK